MNDTLAVRRNSRSEGGLTEELPSNSRSSTSIILAAMPILMAGFILQNYYLSPLDGRQSEAFNQISRLDELYATAQEKIHELTDANAWANDKILHLEDSNSMYQTQISALQEDTANALSKISPLKEAHEIGQWTQWSAYGECSVTCGTGKKIRHRMCFSPNNVECIGDTDLDTNTTPCSPMKCKERKFLLFNSHISSKFASSF